VNGLAWGLVSMLLALPRLAAAQGVDRLYVLDCGWATVADQSRFSPGVNVGVPIDISDNCYLVHHARGGYLLWDTGYPDALASKPEGERTPDGAFWRHRPKTLTAQLAAIGVKPSDVHYVAISHTHPDHVGNVDLFPAATVLIQGAEYDWAFSQKDKPFSAGHPITRLDGDRDVFGDGSVTILSTPGHTPGHSCLLVRLPKTGWVILSGDVAHTQANWDARRVPQRNVDPARSVESMQRIADVMAQRHAQLWINHDKPQSDRLRHAPEFYE
jgi:N-acyl homoserine lactone hydrolase